MYQEELIENEIYYCKDGIYSWIFKNKKDFKGLYIDIYNKGTSTYFKWGSSEIPNIRVATHLEKTWLQACVEANTFVPLEEINQKITIQS